MMSAAPFSPVMSRHSAAASSQLSPAVGLAAPGQQEMNHLLPPLSIAVFAPDGISTPSPATISMASPPEKQPLESSLMDDYSSDGSSWSGSAGGPVVVVSIGGVTGTNTTADDVAAIETLTSGGHPAAADDLCHEAPAQALGVDGGSGLKQHSVELGERGDGEEGVATTMGPSGACPLLLPLPAVPDTARSTLAPSTDAHGGRNDAGDAETDAAGLGDSGEGGGGDDGVPDAVGDRGKANSPKKALQEGEAEGGGGGTHVMSLPERGKRDTAEHLGILVRNEGGRVHYKLVCNSFSFDEQHTHAYHKSTKKCSGILPRPGPCSLKTTTLPKTSGTLSLVIRTTTRCSGSEI